MYASGSAFVSDLFTRCCPLLLAADDAVSNHLLGIGSGSDFLSQVSCC